MTTKTTKLLSTIIFLTTISIMVPGIESVYAEKTWATHGFSPFPATGDVYGVSGKYKVHDADRTGFLAAPTWMVSDLLVDLVEIGWIDISGTGQDVEYYCGSGGNRNERWSATDGESTTFYIYDPQQDGNIDLIGGGDSCEFDIGSYSFDYIKVGYEDSQDSNTLEVNLFQNLKYYDGTWHPWDSSDGAKWRVMTAASVVYCTADDKSNHGDGAGSC